VQRLLDLVKRGRDGDLNALVEELFRQPIGSGPGTFDDRTALLVRI
jgi:hypothetical protein